MGQILRSEDWPNVGCFFRAPVNMAGVTPNPMELRWWELFSGTGGGAAWLLFRLGGGADSTQNKRQQSTNF